MLAVFKSDSFFFLPTLQFWEIPRRQLSTLAWNYIAADFATKNLKLSSCVSTATEGPTARSSARTKTGQKKVSGTKLGARTIVEKSIPIGRFGRVKGGVAKSLLLQISDVDQRLWWRKQRSSKRQIFRWKKVSASHAPWIKSHLSFLALGPASLAILARRTPRTSSTRSWTSSPSLPSAKSKPEKKSLWIFIPSLLLSRVILSMIWDESWRTNFKLSVCQIALVTKKSLLRFRLPESWTVFALI